MKRAAITASFSLIEVTIALGVASFCLIALLGLLPIGVKTNQSSISQTAASSILFAVIADMRATPLGASSSTQFGISFGATKTIYFNAEGASTPTLDANSRYQLTVEFPPNPAGPTAAIFATLKVTWPAAASPAHALGSSETFAAFDRH